MPRRDRQRHDPIPEQARAKLQARLRAKGVPNAKVAQVIGDGHGKDVADRLKRWLKAQPGAR